MLAKMVMIRAWPTDSYQHTWTTIQEVNPPLINTSPECATVNMSNIFIQQTTNRVTIWKSFNIFHSYHSSLVLDKAPLGLSLVFAAGDSWFIVFLCVCLMRHFFKKKFRDVLQAAMSAYPSVSYVLGPVVSAFEGLLQSSCFVYEISLVTTVNYDYNCMKCNSNFEAAPMEIKKPADLKLGTLHVSP